MSLNNIGLIGVDVYNSALALWFIFSGDAMKRDDIILVVNGSHYTLNSSDSQSLSRLPQQEREIIHSLSSALRALNHGDVNVASGSQPATPALNRHPVAEIRERARSGDSLGSLVEQQARNSSEPLGKGHHDLGKGDVDSIVATLMAQEKSKHKAAPAKSSIYKAFTLVILAIFALIFISSLM